MLLVENKTTIFCHSVLGVIYLFIFIKSNTYILSELFFGIIVREIINFNFVVSILRE